MKISIAVFTLSMLVLLSGCFSSGSDASSAKETINVYNWGEYIDEDTIDIFEDETGISVNYQTFNTNEDMYAKIKSGGANYDVIIPSDYMISRMIQEDMLEKLNFDNISNFEKIDAQFKNTEYDPTGEYSVPYTWGTVGIIYNHELVKDTVDSWDILWDEKYTDKVLMFKNPRDAIGIALMKLGYSINTTDENELSQAADLLKEQIPIVQAYVMDQIFEKMVNETALIAPYYAGDAVTMISENPNLSFVVPKEGSNIFTDAMCIPKNAKNKDAAEQFINFMSRPDIAAQNIEFIGYGTPSTEVYDLLPDEAKNDISYPDKKLLENCQPFINLPQETLELYDKLWIDIFK